MIIADTEDIRVYLDSNSARELADTEPYARYHQGVIENLVISPDNKKLYTTAQDGTIAEGDLTDPRHIKFIGPFNGPMQSISSIAFHPGGDFLVVGGNPSTVATWDLNQLNTAHIWHNQILNDAEITDVAYSRTLNLLAVGDDEGSIVFWNVSDPLNITERRKTSIGNPIRHLAFNPGDTALLILGDFASDTTNPRAYSRDLTRLDLSDNLPLFGTDTAEVFAAGNIYILAGETNHGTTSIFSWDISKQAIVRDTTLGSTECPFRDAAYTQNGSLVAVATCKVQL